MRYDEPRHVWTSLPISREREGEGYCVKGVKGGWREGEERVCFNTAGPISPALGGLQIP